MLKTEKRVLSFLLYVLMLVSLLPQMRLPVSAADEAVTPKEGEIIYNGICGDNLQWQLDALGNLSISGFGEMYSYWDCQFPWSIYTSQITKVVIKDGLTRISYGAFINCSSLTTITIPDSVTSIGRSAFDGCSSLTCINIPDSVTRIGISAFSDCSSLTDITIPNSVTWIGEYAFDGCSSLTSITIPDSGTAIGNGAFRNCSSLTDITIPDSAIRIGSDLFYGCSNLTSITIPKSVTSIGQYAFYGCSSLTSISIPDGVTSIGEYAFSDCSRLTSINIPDGVTNIEYGTFSGCSRLTSINIPDSVISIGCESFCFCIRLTSITFLGSAPDINELAFSQVYATAYHPCGDKTWTEDVKQNLFGNIKWKGHLFGRYDPHQDATCTEDATKLRTCPDCGATEIIAVPGTATGHSFGTDGFCTVCGNGPDIIINMTDSCSDSWNGAAIEVYADDEPLTTATVSSGASAQATVPCIPGSTYTFRWRCGNYDSECSFEIIVNGEVLFSGSGNNYSDAETFYTFESATTDADTVLPGDITGDGKLNIMDVVKLYAHVKGAGSLTDEAALKAADYTGDGKINIMDIAKLYATVKG